MRDGAETGELRRDFVAIELFGWLAVEADQLNLPVTGEKRAEIVWLDGRELDIRVAATGALGRAADIPEG